MGDQTYEYDVSGRLVEWTPQSGPAVGYVWDDAGNLVERDGVTATYDARNRLTSSSDGWSYTYSPRGDAVSRTDGVVTVSSEFDPSGRLVDTGSSAVGYDALDRPLSVGADDLAYAGMATEPSLIGTEEFVRGPGDELIGADQGSGWAFWLSDAHGDATVAADEDGSLLGSVEFDPFGTRLSSSGVVSGVGFQGDLTDPGSGAVWMGARWFDPMRAGFVSRDSFAGRPVEPGSLNRYAYAEGSPLSRWDPSGFEAKPREDVEPAKLVWSNTPTTGWAPVGPPPPKTGFSRILDGARDSVLAPVKLALNVIGDVVKCTGGSEGHGCFETVKGVGRGLIALAKDPLLLVRQCLDDLEYCAGGMIGNWAGGKFLKSAMVVAGKTAGRVMDARRFARTVDDVDHLTGTAHLATATERATDDAAQLAQHATEAADTTRVGRWMGADEHAAMVKSGEVQVGSGGTTYVASPASAESYMSQAAPGGHYVEFDVPSSSLRPAGQPDWAQIPSPENTMWGKLAPQRGWLVPESPVSACNIVHVATKLSC